MCSIIIKQREDVIIMEKENNIAPINEELNVKRINEAVRRNKERFPENFCFKLIENETENLRSQIATSSFVCYISILG